MEKKTRNIILITGAVLIVGSIGFVAYNFLKDDNEDSSDTLNEEESNPYVTQKEVVPTNSDTNTNNNVSQASIGVGSASNNDNEVISGLIKPTFNSENELSNSISQLKGRYLYPKRQSVGGWGYSNIRTSAEVNTDRGWWDPSDNLITTINSGTPIGKVVSQTTGVYNGYSYRWFKIKLAKPISGWFSDYTHGFVRADTVTFKPF